LILISIRFDLIWGFDRSKVTIKDPQRGYPISSQRSWGKLLVKLDESSRRS